MLIQCWTSEDENIENIAKYAHNNDNWDGNARYVLNQLDKWADHRFHSHSRINYDFRKKTVEWVEFQRMS